MNNSLSEEGMGRTYSDAMRALRPLLAAALIFSALVNVLMLTG